MAKSEPINSRTIDIQFDKIEKNIKNKMAAMLKETAETCFNNILTTPNPPYKTGSYMASHRIGVNQVDSSDTVFNTIGVLGLDSAIKRSAIELSKLNIVNSADDVVNISNSVGFSTKYGYSWARNVEYAGWDSKKGKVDPYLVYEKAVAKTMHDLPKIAKKVSIIDTKGT